MNSLALREPLRAFIQHLGLDELIAPGELEDGLAQLEVELQRLALDAQAATVRGVPLADAVLDFENFHQLARLHAAVDDILTMSLPAELETWVRRLLASPEPPSLEVMRTALVATAADPTNPLQQALARFFLFEGVRFQLVVMVKWFPTETIGVGLDVGELSRIAESRINGWMAEGDPTPADTRPFHMLVAAALHGLDEHVGELRATIATLQSDFIEAARRHAQIEAQLNEMDTTDALLIRNAIAPVLGEQQLTVDHLQRRHFLAMGDVSRNALDQRFRRARQRGAEGLKRRRVALLDLIRDESSSLTEVR
ncbi:MAG: hypothetical protein R3B13_38885 [Polyangiaceae bacterium]